MSEPLRHAPFTPCFIHAALAIALTAGFGAAALLAVLLGFGLPLEEWWLPLVQAHGYAQTFGWLGLFIMGVSLYFIPRFSGAPLRFPSLPRWSCLLLAVSVAGRLLGQVWLSASPGEPARRWILGLAGVAGIAGVALYVFLLAASLGRTQPRHRAIREVKPYFLTALCGWLLSSLISGLAAIRAALRGAALLDQVWSRLGLDLFLGLVLLPVAFAFSLRTFPLYLRLAPPRWPVRGFAFFYLAAFALEILPVLLLAGGAGSPLHALGKLARGGAILFFVWNLDVLLRRRPPWTAYLEAAPAAGRRFHPLPRPELPDYGEFGRFERLLWAAYLWLSMTALLEAWNGAALLLAAPAPWSEDLVRHLYLAGFGSLLLLGMAPRMIPGFLRVRRLAFPGLVDLSLYLGNAAALARVAPVALAQFLPERFPVLGEIASYLFGISGSLGWLAVLCLAVNLWATLGKRPS